MKKLLLIFLVGLFFSGCSAAQISEFGQHNAMYKSMDLMKYSLWGYQDPTEVDAKKSQEEKWWGIPTPYE